ncbi:substrate-binding periplasmic protein [Duganella callida]|nr:transporter substrate-binding domain-containing protein [Duganella callida]
MALAGPVLTVVTEDFAPYSYVECGRITGYSTELVETSLRRTKAGYSIHIYPWARAFRMARSQPNVLIFSVVRTPEREHQLQWIAPIAPRSVYVYKLAARRDVQVRALADLGRYRVAATRGDVVEEQLHALGLEADLATLDESNLRKMVAGRVDLMVASELSMKAICHNAHVSCGLLERTIAMPGVGEYYVAASLGTPAATVRALRDEFAKMKASSFMQQTADKYGLSLR